MNLTLVAAEDVREDVVQTEPAIITEEITSIDEFKANKELKEVLSGIRELAVGGMDVYGFKSYTLSYPGRNYEAAYFIKGRDVIVVDHHDTNALKVEVLERKEADKIINFVKEAFGEEELYN